MNLDIIGSLMGAPRAEAAAGTPGPTDGYWYTPYGAVSLANSVVTPETAVQASTVLACIKVISETFVIMPFQVMKRSEGRWVEDRTHPLWDVLHDQPNDRMTAAEFWQFATISALLWPAFYAEIIPGSRGFVQQLEPLLPGNVRPEVLRNKRVVYHVQERNGMSRVLSEDMVFRVPSMVFPTQKGVLGASVTQLARDVIGLALSIEGYASKFFANGAKPSMVLLSEQKMDKVARQEMQDGFNATYGGWRQAHKVGMLSHGMKVQKVSSDPEKTQMIESAEATAFRIASVFRVPPAKIGLGLKSAAKANVEQQEWTFVQNAILPLAVKFEQAARRDLITKPESFQAKFAVEGLLRASAKERAEFYKLMQAHLTTDEIRAKENMGPIPGGSELMRPLNQVPASLLERVLLRDKGGTNTQGGAAGQDGGEGGSSRAQALAEPAARRCLAKEAKCLVQLAERHADDPERWVAKVTDFYAKHVEYMETHLALANGTAARYCAARCADVLAGGMKAAERAEATELQPLIMLATEPAHV